MPMLSKQSWQRRPQVMTEDANKISVDGIDYEIGNVSDSAKEVIEITKFVDKQMRELSEF